jgi:hypothetical protein
MTMPAAMMPMLSRTPTRNSMATAASIQFFNRSLL